MGSTNSTQQILQENDKVPPYTVDNPALNKSSQLDRVKSPAYVDSLPSKQDKKDELDAKEVEVEEAKQSKREENPLMICKLMTSWPKLFFGLTLVCQIGFFVITALLVQTGYDIFPHEFKENPLDIRDNDDYLKTLAWTKRDADGKTIVRKAQTEAIEPRSAQGYHMELYFEFPGGNVFSPDNLKIIKEVEEQFWGDKQFQADFCHLQQYPNHSTFCTRPVSIIRYFDGSFGPSYPKFFDPNFTRVPEVLHEASTNPMTKEGFQYFLSKDSVITQVLATASLTRCRLSLGLPLAGYNGDEQYKKIVEFLENNFMALGDRLFKSGVGDMDFFYRNVILLKSAVNSQVFEDMLLSVGSFIYILIFLHLQTGSFWISGLAIISILSALCCTNLIYRVILDFRYLGIFHVLSLFIILGIGVDDVFVFYDTWKESSHHYYPTLAHRLSDTYRRASKAMLFTSLTTALAFAVSATSPFLMVYSFGVFSGILVAANYMSVITFFPTVIITYHLYWEQRKCCCCGHKQTEVEIIETTPIKDSRRKHIFVRFFRGPYYKFVTHRIMRWMVIAGFTLMLILFTYFASTIRVNDEQLEVMPENTNVGKSLIKRNLFKVVDPTFVPTITLLWGLKKQNLSGCHKTDFNCFGKSVWDENFNLNSEEAQSALLRLCENLQSLTDEELDSLAISRNIITGQPEVKCFPEQLKQFLKEEETRKIQGQYRYEGHERLSYPVSPAEGKLIMSKVTIPQEGGGTPLLVYDPLPPSGFNRYFEIANSLWLHGGFDPADPGNDKAYRGWLGETEDPPYTKIKNLNGYNYSYGTKLRYASIKITTTINFDAVGHLEGLVIRDAWETWLSNQLSSMPDSLKGGFQCNGYDGWHWLTKQKVIAEDALKGLAIGIAIACPVLIIATQNIIVGFMATLSIVCTIVCVVGIIPMAGWKVGVFESLNMMLVVGLAVDYVVHLAEGYSRSMHPDRLGRVQDTLEEVGISVLSGACTTLGASFVLLFAKIIFFTQFGTFMFCTIGFSIIFALGFFITIMGIMGPQGETGSFKLIYQKCLPCCKKNKIN